MPPRVEAVILAAGLARRMGSAKLEEIIGGVPVIVRVARAALESTLDRVILVTGPENSRMLDALGPLSQDSRLTVVVNPEPWRGMSSSLIAGVREARQDALGALIALADQPFLSSEVLNELRGTFLTDPTRIVAPLVRGRRSNPVVFPADLFRELLEVTGDSGGRTVLERNSHRVVGVEMGDFYDDSDLDTPEDLAILRGKGAASEKAGL